MAGHIEIIGTFKGKTGSMYEIMQDVQSHLSSAMRQVPIILKAELSRILADVVQDLGNLHDKDYPSNSGSDNLNRRSGKAMQSIKDKTKVSGSGSIESISGTVAGIGYLEIHETGGTIRAQNSKYLTIPTEYALHSNGTPIKPRARDWRDTFIATSKAGNLIIFQKRGKEIVPLYILKTQVRIKPRLKMGATLDKNLPRFVQDFMYEVDKVF